MEKPFPLMSPYNAETPTVIFQANVFCSTLVLVVICWCWGSVGFAGVEGDQLETSGGQAGEALFGGLHTYIR